MAATLLAVFLTAVAGAFLGVFFALVLWDADRQDRIRLDRLASPVRPPPLVH